jgi:hypothetical protein
MINAHNVDSKLYRAVERIPRTGQLENIEAHERDLYVLVRGYFGARRDETMSPAVLHRPDILAEDNARRFVDDIVRLVVWYLRKR